MKKANIVALIFIIATIGVNSLTVVALATLLPHPVYFPAVESPSSDFPYLQGVTQNGGYYNISLAFSNVTYIQQLDNILVNPNSPEDKTAPTIYINRTITTTYPLSRLQRGDNLQVNLILPCNEYTSGSTLNLCIMGNCFLCGKSLTLP